MPTWKRVYSSGEFSITTEKPSKLVFEYAHKLPANSKILDLGCGAGRNSIFLASEGHTVDAIDSTDLNWISSLSATTKEKIVFIEQDINTIQNLDKVYDAILLIRLMQYLPQKTVIKLFELAGVALRPGGLVIASFNYDGSVRVAKLGIKTYAHPPNFVKELCERNSLKVLTCKTQATVSQHVPYHSKINVCEIVAQKSG